MESITVPIAALYYGPIVLLAVYAVILTVLIGKLRKEMDSLEWHCANFHADARGLLFDLAEAIGFERGNVKKIIKEAGWKKKKQRPKEDSA